MKKSVKIASLAIALFAGLGSTAQAEGFKIGADVVSSYVWRGTDYGDSPAIQPNLSYTFPGIGVVVGAWGSYYIPVDGNSDSFDFSDDGPNVLEASVGYSYKNLGLLAAINIAGADTDNAKYCEATYKFYDKDGFTAKAVVGAGDETYVEGDNDNFTVVNTGISVAKDRFTASYIYNPDTEKSHLVFMASF